MSKIKETIYDTNEVDNLYKIVDKLVELRNDPFKYDEWNIKYNYILSELQTYNRYIDYNNIRMLIRMLINTIYKQYNWR